MCENPSNAATADMLHAETTIRKSLEQPETGNTITELYQAYRSRPSAQREALFVVLLMRVVTRDRMDKANVGART